MKCGRDKWAAASQGDILSLSLSSNPTAVREALFDAIQMLQAIGVVKDDLVTVEIILAEVLNNIVEHALPGRSGRICIEMAPSRQGLGITVSDCGCEMPGGRIPVAFATDHPDSTQELPEGGYGWPLIRQLAQDLIYSRRGGINSLSFRVTQSSASAAFNG